MYLLVLHRRKDFSDTRSRSAGPISWAGAWWSHAGTSGFADRRGRSVCATARLPLRARSDSSSVSFPRAVPSTLSGRRFATGSRCNNTRE